jgi:hypothetical protein
VASDISSGFNGDTKLPLPASLFLVLSGSGDSIIAFTPAVLHTRRAALIRTPQKKMALTKA